MRDISYYLRTFAKKKHETMVKNIPIGEIELNKGQVEGLPKNPRFIKDYRFEALKKSIQDAPEMLSLRELIVYPYGGKYVVIGGNMRLRACKELGFKEVPCKVLDEQTPADKLREYTIKDNNAFGDTDFDLLANEWDTDELGDWGVEFPSAELEQEESEEPTDLDAENENKPFVVKLTFENPQDIDKFMKAYADNLRADYRCIISISGGEL